MTAMGAAKKDAIYLAAVDVLAAAAEIGKVAPLPSFVDTVRQDMVSLLRQFVSRCRESGIADTETAEARYALVAFIDDRVLASNWVGRSEWMSNPLQYQLFREYVAGENFFARMRALTRRDGPSWALEIYYLCLALGFTGAAGGERGALQPAHEFASATLPRLTGGVNPARIAPHAVPVETLDPMRRAFPIALATVAGCIAVCVLGLVGLHLSLGGAIASARRSLDAAPRVQPPAALRP